MRDKMLKGTALLLALLLMIPCVMAEESGKQEEDMENTNVPAYEFPKGFCYVSDVIPDVIIEMRYATDYNFTGKVVDGYEGNFAIMTIEAANALKEAADEFREMGYTIKVYDAYRPLSAVRAFVKWSESPRETSMKEIFYPEYDNKTLLVDQGYIARNSSHCRGSALDMTLVDADGNELDMGTCFDYFGNLAWHGAKKITEEQTANRELLCKVMEKHGFRPFEKEWWHYRLSNEPFSTSFDFPVR